MGTDFQILGGSGLLFHPRHHAIQQVMGGVRFLTVEVSNLAGFPCSYLPGTETPWQDSMIFPLFQQHFSTNRRNSIPSRKLLFYHAKLGYYHGNSRLLPDSTIFPQSPLYQRHIKHKKWGSPTTVMNPTKPQNPLILSHFPILLPSSTQNPMTSIGNCRLCRC